MKNGNACYIYREKYIYQVKKISLVSARLSNLFIHETTCFGVEQDALDLMAGAK